jgi:hypothetical protein
MNGNQLGPEGEAGDRREALKCDATRGLIPLGEVCKMKGMGWMNNWGEGETRI